MRTIWHSLAWKEWHEHKWKLASLTAIVVGVACVPLLYWSRDALVVGFGMAALSLFPLALFIGAGEAAGERSRGTLAFTQALPIPPWKVATQKLLFGLLTCLVPMLIALAALCGIYFTCNFLGIKEGLRLDVPNNVGSPGEWLAAMSAVAVAAAASLFLWTVAFGINRKDEVSAGAWALLAIVLWWTTIITIPQIFDLRARPGDDPLIAMVFAASPGGYAVLELNPRDVASRWLTLPIAITVHAGLAVWYIMRFGRLTSLGIASPQPAVRASRHMDWLPPPRRSPLAAIVWKQCRDSGPIVLAGLAGVAGFVVLVLLASDVPPDANGYALLVVGITAYFGALITLVVGIGVFWQDLTPQLNTFWRSRPINPDTWFWTKLLSGLGVLVVTFGVPLIVAGLMAFYGHPDFDDVAVFFVLVPLWIYMAAIVMTCLVRHAVYAAILSMAVMYTGVLLVVGVVRLTGLASGRIGWDDSWEPSAAEMAAAMILTTIVSTLVAWLAVRYDWGRKSRY